MRLLTLKIANKTRDLSQEIQKIIVVCSIALKMAHSQKDTSKMITKASDTLRTEKCEMSKNDCMLSLKKT